MRCRGCALGRYGYSGNISVGCRRVHSIGVRDRRGGNLEPVGGERRSSKYTEYTSEKEQAVPGAHEMPDQGSDFASGLAKTVGPLRGLRRGQANASPIVPPDISPSIVQVLYIDPLRCSLERFMLQWMAPVARCKQGRRRPWLLTGQEVGPLGVLSAPLSTPEMPRSM